MKKTFLLLTLAIAAYAPLSHAGTYGTVDKHDCSPSFSWSYAIGGQVTTQAISDVTSVPNNTNFEGQGGTFLRISVVDANSSWSYTPILTLGRVYKKYSA